MTEDKGKASGQRWRETAMRSEVSEILQDRPEPVFFAMRRRVGDALAMEFNQEAARWATDSVIEAVFGRDDWGER